MCGFAGCLLTDDLYRPDSFTEQIQTMAQQIAHRGPDDDAEYFNQKLGIGWRRLSIVDSENGSQPFFSEDNSIILMVNGEIFNHAKLKSSLKRRHDFKSNSDCEVLLHLYEEVGIDFLSTVNGMFSLVLWDNTKHRLLLARDRLGIKPLFFNVSNARLLFASEIKALLSFHDCPRQFDWDRALQGISVFSHPINYELETFFVGIEQLRGGEYLLLEQTNGRDFSLTRAKFWSYEKVLAAGAKSSLSRKKIVEHYIDLLQDSVSLMLMADGEVGMFLSGGIDSASIAYFASQKKEVRTFTCVNESTLVNGDVNGAINCSRHLKLPNYQIRIENNNYDCAFWKSLLWACETPYCSMEHLYKYQMHKVISATFPKLKVILLGQGSDEFNGGYSKMFLGLDEHHKNNEWPIFEHCLKYFQAEGISQSRFVKLKPYTEILNDDFLLGDEHKREQLHYWHNYMNSNTKRLQMENLWLEDRVAMIHGIENRVPFLDHRIVEWLAQVPSRYFKQLFWDKSILRSGMSRYLPPQIVDQPKIPFFHGKGVGFSNNFLFSILTKNGSELLHTAFEFTNGKHPIVNKERFANWIKRSAKEKNSSSIQKIILIINMLLLESMGKERFQKPQVTSVDALISITK